MATTKVPTAMTSHEVDIYAAETSRIQALTDLLKYIPITSPPTSTAGKVREAALTQIAAILDPLKDSPNVSGPIITRVLSTAPEAKKP